MFGLVGTVITRVQMIAAAVVVGALLTSLPVTYFVGRIQGKAKCEAKILKSGAKADVRADDVTDALDAVEDKTQPIIEQGRVNQGQAISAVRNENHLLRVEIDKLKREASNEDTTDWGNDDLPASVRHKWVGINQQIFGSSAKLLPSSESLAKRNEGSTARDATSSAQ